MARSLETLQKQYNSKGADTPGGRGMGFGRPGGPGGGRGRGAPGAGGGKPKNTKKTLRRLCSYLRGNGIRLALVLICMLISTVTSLIGSYLLAPIIDKLTFAVNPDAELRVTAVEKIADGAIQSVLGKLHLDPNAVMTYITAGVVLLGGIYLVGILTSYVQSRLMLSTSQRIVEHIRNDLFEKLQRLPLRYYDARPTGEIMSRFTNDIDNIDTMINNSLTSFVSGFVTLIGTFLFMLTTSWILTLITVAFIPIFMKLLGMIGKRSSRYYSSQQAALGAVNGYMEETVTGQKVVKVFNHEDDCLEEFNLLNDDMRGKQFKAQFWGGVMGPIMGNTSQISYGMTVGIGGVLMIAGLLTPGGLTVFANYSRHFSMPINQLSQLMTTMFAALAGAERVFDVMDADPEPEDAEDADCMENPKGDVVLEHVNFGYLPEKTVLHDICLHAKPGEKIAFVGSTGAGKTTVTNLLNRFYDISEGEIRIDGTDVRQIRRDILRRNIAMVLQDTHLFTGTIMENIRYGRPDATDDEVIEAAKTASAHSFIMRLSDGYQTKLEGDGGNLSQGQRQLLNIARAAISKAPILVLDEATSSVDTRTERHIEHGMDRLMKNRTTFVIAHRLSTVRNADEILVLEHGVIIERGSHDELLALKGRYYELYTGVVELA